MLLYKLTCSCIMDLISYTLSSSQFFTRNRHDKIFFLMKIKHKLLVEIGLCSIRFSHVMVKINSDHLQNVIDRSLKIQTPIHYKNVMDRSLKIQTLNHYYIKRSRSHEFGPCIFK